MPFDLAAVERQIAATRFAQRITHHSSVSSTNTLALEAARAGAAEAVWVADEQTAGRGRGGHQWHSAAGDGLYVSALVKPSLLPRDALLLSLATGLAANTAIAEVARATIDIRWPNDLLVDGKKCGGILVETAFAAESEPAHSMLRYAVIGVGLNLNHAAFPDELSPVATSLRIAGGGSSIHREDLLAALLIHLDREITLLTSIVEDASVRTSLLARFTATSTWAAGKRVRVAEAGGYTGVTAGLNAEGFLKVLDDDGHLRTVLSGGVREL